jgi:Na+/phosphate symporter
VSSPVASEDLEESGSFLYQELIPALLVGGVLLFFFPEPVTSTLGIVLVALGVGR